MTLLLALLLLAAQPAPPVVPIGAVQGAVADTDNGTRHQSPLKDQTVAIRGVITELNLQRSSAGVLNSGLFIQNTTTDADADPLTSDGLFVFIGRTGRIGDYQPRVGDEVVLSGRVGEFFNLTQLEGPRLVQLVRGDVDLDAEVPAFDARPPDEVAEAQRYWERNESMRARVPAGAVVLGGRDVFGSSQDSEIWIARGDAAIAARADPYVRRAYRDPHPLDDRADSAFDNGNGYRLLIGNSGLAATLGADTLLAPARTFAPFDYVPDSDATYQARLANIAAQITGDLQSPDIVLVQEAEDQDICSVVSGTLVCGSQDDADGRPDVLQELGLATQAAGGPAYLASLDRDGADDRGIISGFLYRADRVQLLGARASDPVLGSAPHVVYRADALPYNSDVQNPKALNAHLPSDVDRSTGTDGSNVYTRAAQVGLFRVWQDQVGVGGFVDLYAVSNHFSSGPDARVGQRREQAAYDAAIAQALLGARVLIGGDLNVYPRPDDPLVPPSDQLGPLYDAGLTNLWDRLVADTPASAYSYVFDGQAQTLDQLFLAPSLLADLVSISVAHINADWPADEPNDGARGTSDHDPPVAVFRFAMTSGTK